MANVDAEGDWAGTFLGPFLAKLNNLFPIEVFEANFAKPILQQLQTKCL